MHGASSMQFSTIYIVTQDNLIGVLFNGLIAELPTILDSFLPTPQVIT